MAIGKFKPEIWSSALLVPYRKTLVYTAFCNHDYEGEIAAYGDTVRITSIGRPTIFDYVPNVTNLQPEVIQDTQRTLVIDQAKAFAFAVDDVDKRQARGDVMSQAMDEASFGWADVTDQFLSSKYTDIQVANQLGSITLSLATPTQAYDNLLVPLKVKLDKANVPTIGRSIAITPDIHGLLLRDPRFVKVNESGTSDGLRNGMVGRAAGFDILLTNNAPTPSNGVSVVIAGTNRGITFGQQLVEVEAYRPQSSFSDAIKGLNVYGAKTVRPDALASALVTVGA